MEEEAAHGGADGPPASTGRAVPLHGRTRAASSWMLGLAGSVLVGAAFRPFHHHDPAHFQVLLRIFRGLVLNLELIDDFLVLHAGGAPRQLLRFGFILGHGLFQGGHPELTG